MTGFVQRLTGVTARREREEAARREREEAARRRNRSIVVAARVLLFILNVVLLLARHGLIPGAGPGCPF
jgi:hypothetical protein